MKRTVIISAAVIAVFFVFLSSVSFAQGGKNGGGWGPGTSYSRLYNAKTVETLSGRVEKVELFTPGKGMSQGVHILVKTDKESIPVHLGPSWYIDRQGVKLEPGDKVQVTGSRVTYKDKPAIIASEVKKGEQTLKLRDVSGVPVWSGRAR